VLLHGGAGSWAHWVRNIPFLARHFTLWVPDLPGMGESALPPEPWTPRSIAGILDQGIDALIGTGARVALLGFSFGGMVAGHWAALAPQRVARIVVAAAAGTGLATAPTGAMRSWRRVQDPQQRREIHRENLRTWMLHDPAAADELAAWIAMESVERDRLRNREVSTTDSLLQAMAQVRCPAHAIYGDEDVLYKQTQPEVEQALAAAGFASVTWLPRAGHWSPFEQAGEFNALALELLGGPDLQGGVATAG
jgi:pimeloyl-ACP methyl ester carboxylesterase